MNTNKATFWTVIFLFLSTGLVVTNALAEDLPPAKTLPSGLPLHPSRQHLAKILQGPPMVENQVIKLSAIYGTPDHAIATAWELAAKDQAAAIDKQREKFPVVRWKVLDLEAFDQLKRLEAAEKHLHQHFPTLPEEWEAIACNRTQQLILHRSDRLSASVDNTWDKQARRRNAFVQLQTRFLHHLDAVRSSKKYQFFRRLNNQMESSPGEVQPETNSSQSSVLPSSTLSF